MDALPGDADGLTPDTGPRVAAAVDLLHHRRIWGWILAGSVIGLAAGIAARIVASQGAPAIVSGIAGAAFIVLGVVALIVIAVETNRWFRTDPVVRAQVLRQITHHSLAAHALGVSGHVLGRTFLWLLIAAWMAFAVLLVPAVVNSVAYLAGAGPTATFVAQSYTQECGRGGCYYVTDGMLLTHPPVSVTWPEDVPLDSTFQVRRPVWGIFGYSRDLLNGPDSGFTIGASVVVDGLAGLIIALLVREARRKLRSRLLTADAQTAAAEPGGTSRLRVQER